MLHSSMHCTLLLRKSNDRTSNVKIALEIDLDYCHYCLKVVKNANTDPKIGSIMVMEKTGNS